MSCYNSYAEVKSFVPPFNSAPVIDHNGEPAYSVLVNGIQQTLTVSEVVTKYLKTLYTSAQDFLGRKIDSAVFAIPAHFTAKQRAALSAASEAAGVKVAQMIPETAAAAVAYGLTTSSSTYPIADRNLLFLDVGASTTTATVAASRGGVIVPLTTVIDNTLGGDELDARLVDFFSKEFTKKTKVKIAADNHRAITKLRLQVESTKRTLSASTSATCAVESLAEGVDFSGTVNRTRFDLLSAKVYQGIVDKAKEAITQAGLDPLQIHEVCGPSALSLSLLSSKADSKLCKRSS